MLYLEETKPPNSRGGRQETDQSASILTLMKDRRTGCGPRIACQLATAAVVSLRRHSLLLVLLLHDHAAPDRLTWQRVLCRTTTLLYGIWCLVEIVRNEVREWHFLEFCPPPRTSASCLLPFRSGPLGLACSSSPHQPLAEGAVWSGSGFTSSTTRLTPMAALVQGDAALASDGSPCRRAEFQGKGHWHQPAVSGPVPDNLAGKWHLI